MSASSRQAALGAEAAPAQTSNISPPLVSSPAPELAPAAAGTGRGDDRALRALCAMLEQVPGLALIELERAIRLTLHPPVSARRKRVAELGELAELLGQFERGELAVLELPPSPEELVDEGWLLVPRLPRWLYEQARRPEAPSADDLVARYGGWPQVRRAAYGLLPDGRYRGFGRPWSHPSRRGAPLRVHTVASVVEDIRACAIRLGRRPTSSDYFVWQRDPRRRRGPQRKGQARRRPADLRTIYRHFKSWADALAHTTLTDEQLARRDADLRRRFTEAARTHRTPAELLAELPAERLAELGLDGKRALKLTGDDLAELELARAVMVCRELGGSFAWLCGRDAESGTPPSEGLVFAGDQYRRLRAARGVPERQVMDVLDLSLSEIRALATGRSGINVGELLTLAQALDVPWRQLCAVPDP